MSASDINWTELIPHIDQQLDILYGLEDDEIAVDTQVKPMEALEAQGRRAQTRVLTPSNEGIAMAWRINCSDRTCEKTTTAWDIVDLLDNHRDDDGWFLCGCGNRGLVEKSFELQEGGTPWTPFLKGALRLGTDGEIYQPFVFLVGYAPDGPVGSVWFSYYKDLRTSGGRLKLGYGPGGPPVLSIAQVRELVDQLADIA